MSTNHSVLHSCTVLHISGYNSHHIFVPNLLERILLVCITSEHQKLSGRFEREIIYMVWMILHSIEYWRYFNETEVLVSLRQWNYSEIIQQFTAKPSTSHILFSPKTKHAHEHACRWRHEYINDIFNAHVSVYQLAFPEISAWH